MSLKELASTMSAKGRGPDDVLVHMSSKELAGLQGLALAAGGSLTVNPETGLPEAGFLDSLLPSILGFAANFIVPGSGMLVGAATGAMQNKESPLMGALLGGMGGYGAGQLAGGLSNLGATTAQAAVTPAAEAAGQAALEQAAQQTAQQAAIGQGLQQAGAQGLTNAGGLGLNATPSLSAPTASYQLSGMSQPLNYELADAGRMAYSQAAPATDAAYAARNQAMADEYLGAADKFRAQPKFDQFMQGAKAAYESPSAYLQELGGGKAAFKSGLMAAAPLGMYAPDSGLPDEATAKGKKYRYDAGATGVVGSPYYESVYFSPTYTELAEGGEVDKPDVAKGMSGQSADAFRYLMGQSSTAPKAPETTFGNINWDKAVVKTGQFMAPKSAPASGVPSLLKRTAFGSGSSTQPATEQLYQQVKTGYTFDPNTQTYADKYEYKPYTPPSSNTSYSATERGGSGGRYKGGGAVNLESGGFVVPADVVSALGNGSSSAGLAALKKLGAKPIQGKGDGQSDSITANIDGKHRAAVAREEAYFPPKRVKAMGGAKKLYAMMDKIRMQAHGKREQQRPVNPKAALS